MREYAPHDYVTGEDDVVPEPEYRDDEPGNSLVVTPAVLEVCRRARESGYVAPRGGEEASAARDMGRRQYLEPTSVPGIWRVAARGRDVVEILGGGS